MKKLTLLLALSFTFFSAVACQKTKVLWSTTENLKQPESAVYSPAHKAIFVSNVDGDFVAKDGKGYISMFSRDGRSLASPWIDGLNAPKGLAISGERLYVTDIDELVVIHVDKSVIEARYPVPGAKFLNDVAVAPSGEVYFSDTMDNAIYVLKDGKVETLVKDAHLQSPNGLFFQDGKLYVASWGILKEGSFETTQAGHILKLDPAAKSTEDFHGNKPLGNLDGLILTQDGFLVSDWMNGKVYRGDAKGKLTPLLELGQGTADIGFIPDGNVLLVPQMMKNELKAYQL